jgi:hypothetical protein
MKRFLPFTLLLTIVGIAVLATWAPLEKTLGVSARLVYLHGAWVWAAMILFLSAAAAGAAGLLLRSRPIQEWSRAIGLTGLVMWIIFLPQSLFLMQASWNGLFLEEPRFRTPLNLAVGAVLLQVGLYFLPLVWTALGNLLYGVVFFFSMNGLETVLHPDSPVATSESNAIRFFFAGLLVLILAGAVQLTVLLRKEVREGKGIGEKG